MLKLIAAIVVLVLLVLYLWREAYATRVILFYKPSCGACKRFKADGWKDFSNQNHIAMGVKIYEYDTSLEKNKKISEVHKVTSVPCVIKIKSDNIVEQYGGDRSVESLNIWARL